MSAKPDTPLYELKDDAYGSRAKYVIRKERDEQGRPIIEVSVFTLPDEVYHDATRSRVLQPDAVMPMRFTQPEALRFATIMVEGVSKHLEAVRRSLYMRPVLDDTIELEHGAYTITLRAHSAKTNGYGVQKNSARLIMIITRKSDGEEMLVLRLKRNRIIWFLQTFREIFHSLPKVAMPVGTIDGGRELAVRNSDYVAIGPIWLHGRELQKFQDYIERVVFDFTYVTGSGRELFRYRQVRAGFSEIENVVAITLTRFTPEHRVFKDEEGNKQIVKLLVTSSTVARLFLLLPLFYVRQKDVEVAHAQEAEMEIDTTELPENDITVVSDTKELLESEREGDLLLNMIESQIALFVDKKERFSVKDNIGKISFFARYRDGVLADPNYKVRKANKTGVLEDSSLLPSVRFDLGLTWINLFAIIAESLHNKKGEGTNEYGRIVRRWAFAPEEGVQYILKTVFSEDNKAVALIIDRFAEMTDEMTGIGTQLHEGRMRLPLFKEHVRSLMKGLIHVAQQFDSYYFTRVIDVFDPSKDVFEKRNFGIRRFISAKTGEGVFVGSVATGEKFSGIELSETDRDHLKKSAYNRLLYGRWMPFVGDDIALTFDGYLSDHEREYCIEFDRETTQGAGGSVAALAILFVCVSHLHPENDTSLAEVSQNGEQK